MSASMNENISNNIFIYKLVNITDSKKKSVINNLCWFCNMKCSSYVRICENCKYEKYEKKRKIKQEIGLK